MSTEFFSHLKNVTESTGSLKLVDLSDLTNQVSVLNPTPRFTGSYSFVYLGKLGEKMARSGYFGA
jgi:hypothetical protein